MEGEKQEGERGSLASPERQALGLVPAHPPAQTLAKSHQRESIAFLCSPLLVHSWFLSLSCTYAVHATLGIIRECNIAVIGC